MICFNGFLSIFCTVIFQIFCFRRNHRCIHLLEAKPSPRNTKKTFIQYVAEVQQYIDVIAEATNSRRVLNANHNGAINTFIDSLAVNAVLGSSCSLKPVWPSRSVYCSILLQLVLDIVVYQTLDKNLTYTLT